MTSEEALYAELFLNLKGNKHKRENWISIAEKCQKIVNKSKTRKEASEKLGVSYQLLRSILSLLKLPEEVQTRIKEREILFDAAQRINTIKNSNRQKEVAKTIAGLTSHEQREIIQYAKKFPNAKLSGYKKRVTTPRNVEKLHVAIIPLEEKTYQILQRECRKRKHSLEKILVSIIEQWLENNKK